MSEVKHTPTPWRLEPPHASCDDVIANVVGTDDVITSSYPANFANAEHIVKCVNMHDELVAVMSDIHDFLKRSGYDTTMVKATLKKAGAL